MRPATLVLGTTLVVLVALGAAGCGKTSTSSKPLAISPAVTAASNTVPVTTAATIPASTAPAPTAPSLTPSQQNAIQAAKDYLSTSAFSRLGLIQQLSSKAGSGYPLADATFAVDSLQEDWNAQAASSAKEYLSTQSFSCNGLIQQLSSSAGAQFTAAQAEYGAKAAGIC
jgi:Host cell surface-exposed lipoprotein